MSSLGKMVRDALGDAVPRLRKYRDKIEKEMRDFGPRLGPNRAGLYGPRPGSGLSLKTTRFEFDASTKKKDVDEKMRIIAAGLTADSVEINGTAWTQADLPVPRDMGLTVSGVRIDLERAIDKLRLSGDVLRAQGALGLGSVISQSEGSWELVQKVIRFAVRDYIDILMEPMSIIKVGLKEYTNDLIGTGELSFDDARDIRSDRGQAILMGSHTFREFFDDWIATSAPWTMRNTWKAKMKSVWVESLFSVMPAVGTLDLDSIETSMDPKLTKVERALVFDPGFRYYVSGKGGRICHYWDWCRNILQPLGRYTGQW